MDGFMKQTIKNSKILMVDDQEEFINPAKGQLQQFGFDVHTESDSVALWEVISNKSFNPFDYDAMLLDVKMPVKDGIDILKAIEATKQTHVFPIIILTAVADQQRALECINLGAWDYVLKPPHWADIAFRIQRAIRTYEKYRQAKQAVEDVRKRAEESKKLTQYFALPLEEDLPKTSPTPEMIGESIGMRVVYYLIERASKSEAAVLVLGESGTGKELIARAIHYNSARRDMPFVAVNCAAVPESLLESEFFGAEKGAYTSAVKRKRGRFELADKGTIFLDEIGDISPNLQVKLLRVVQHKTFERLGGESTITVDARIIAATNRNLQEAMSSGHFREDLYYRLNVIPIQAPPLRDRNDDIPNLAKYFISRHQKTTIAEVDDGCITPECLNAMMKYRWPGNVRELENIVERALTIGTIPLRLGMMPEELRSPGDVRQNQITTVTTKPSSSENLPSVNIPLFQECKWLTTEHQRILVNVMLFVDAWGTDSTRAPEQERHQRSLASRLRSMFDVRADKARFPACPTIHIGKMDEYKRFQEKVASEFANEDTAHGHHAEKFKRNYQKIKQVVIAADILLGAYQKRRNFASMLSEIDIKSGINSRKHIQDRIDLLTLILLGIIPEGINDELT